MFLKKISSLCAYAVCFALTLIAFASEVQGAARMSGKILSINGNVYFIELGDGSKIKVKLKEGAKSLRSQSSGAFKTGEEAVFNIISALNDNPLLADSIMDVAYARQNTAKAYVMPRDTRIGGFATTAGPSATGGARPNAVGQIGIGGSQNINPPVTVNAPFTASPAPLNSPFTGEALTSGSNIPQPQTPNAPNAAASSQYNMPGAPSPMSPLNTPGPSGLYEQPNQGSYNQPMMNLTVGDSPAQNQDPASLIMGNSTMKGGTPDPYNPYGGTTNPYDAASLFSGGGGDEEEEADPLDALNPANTMGQMTQITGKVMNLDASKGIIFYMATGAPGMQELGSAIVTQRTIMLDGRTGNAIAFGNIIPGSIIRIEGIMQNGTIQATRITLTQ